MEWGGRQSCRLGSLLGLNEGTVSSNNKRKVRSALSKENMNIDEMRKLFSG